MTNLFLLLITYFLFVGSLSFVSYNIEKRKKTSLRNSIDDSVRKLSSVYKD